MIVIEMQYRISFPLFCIQLLSVLNVRMRKVDISGGPQTTKSVLEGMSMKKSGFTLEQHKEIGAKLGLIRNELTDLSIKIGDAYNLKIVNDLTIAISRIDKLRSSLDDKVIAENPALGDEILLNIYYGNLSGKQP